MSRADKKQRQKAKRNAKQQEARRRESASPVKRLAEAPGEPQCWISDTFEENGQLQLFAFKRGAGLSGFVAFLIDQGVVGLKDTWVRMNADLVDFQDMIDDCRNQGIHMRQTDAAEARRWVAGSARWANDHGMRLPKDWIRHAALLGDVGDWHNADVRPFLKEFAGHPEDLRQRLIGESYDSFLKRKDIEFILTDLAPYTDLQTDKYHGGIFEGQDDDDDDEEEDFDDDTDDDGWGEFELDEDELETIMNELPEQAFKKLAERIAPAVSSLAGRTTDWLAERFEMASPELSEAWESIMIASMISNVAMPVAKKEKNADFGLELLNNLSDRIEPPRQKEYQRAIQQVTSHLKTDPLMMKKVLLEHGLDDEPDDPSSAP